MSASSPQSASLPVARARVARQAIFDRKLELYGYELLYRGPRGIDGAWNGDQASSATMLDAFLEIGIERVVGPHCAFINFTYPLLTQIPNLPLAPDRAVLEILEDVPIDSALIKGIERLRANGYRIALDDYQFNPIWEPVLPHVDIVKVDIPSCSWDTLKNRLHELRRPGVKLLAEKVETHESYQRLHALGFDLFQGYFFAKPNLVHGKRLSENRAVVLRLLARLNDPDVAVTDLEDLIAQDSGLSYKVLRYVNSATFSLSNEIDSIRRAIVLLGLVQIRGWANLLAMAGLDDTPPELLHLGLLRAHLCEELTRHSRIGSPDTGYTVGLFSVLDALLNQPMSELLIELPFPKDIALAIGQQDGPYGSALACAIEMEQGRWDTPYSRGINADDLSEIYLSSTERTFQVLELLR